MRTSFGVQTGTGRPGWWSKHAKCCHLLLTTPAPLNTGNIQHKQQMNRTRKTTMTTGLTAMTGMKATVGTNIKQQE
jgi:hypothetical protein